MNSDVVSQVNIGLLINTHVLKTSDVTMMLSSVNIDETIDMNKKLKSGTTSSSSSKSSISTVKPVMIDEEDREYIALRDDGRVMMKVLLFSYLEYVNYSLTFMIILRLVQH